MISLPPIYKRLLPIWTGTAARTSALRSSRDRTHQEPDLVGSSCCTIGSSSVNTGCDSHPEPTPRARNLRELRRTNTRRNRYGKGPRKPGDCHQSPAGPGAPGARCGKVLPRGHLREPTARGLRVRRGGEALTRTGTGRTGQRPEGPAGDRRETEAARDRAGRSGPHAPRHCRAHSPPPYTPPLMAVVGRGLAEDYRGKDSSGRGSTSRERWPCNFQRRPLRQQSSGRTPAAQPLLLVSRINQ